MTTRWEVEEAVNESDIDPPGRHIVLALLTKSTAGTAEIPPKYAPSFTELERLTGYSRSALAEWMKALADAGWVCRVKFEGESKEGFRLLIGDPKATRAPRLRANKSSTKSSTEPHIPSPREAMDSDAPCRQAVQVEGGGVSPGDMGRTAERYGDIPPGDTNDAPPIRKNSPTESSLTTPPLNPPLFAEDNAPKTDPAPTTKTRRTKKPETYREDVEVICKYLAEAVVAGGSARPPISEKWREQARLLLDADRTPRATPDRVTALIDWIQANDWWRARVLSMPKLRAKYDEIRLDAVRDFNRNKPGGVGAQNGAGYRSSAPANRLTNSHENVDRYDALI